jgi:hypothetical protein
MRKILRLLAQVGFSWRWLRYAAAGASSKEDGRSAHEPGKQRLAIQPEIARRNAPNLTVKTAPAAIPWVRHRGF